MIKPLAFKFLVSLGRESWKGRALPAKPSSGFGQPLRARHLNGDVEARWGKNRWPLWIYFTGLGTSCTACKAMANACKGRQRAKKKQRMPSWANPAKIAEVYKQSALVTAQTGIEHHVDHIIPLNGSLVCGLHTHDNLRVLRGTENRAKSNAFDTSDPTGEHFAHLLAAFHHHFP